LPTKRMSADNSASSQGVMILSLMLHTQMCAHKQIEH
jgi:hypothetical protein